nr:hypothetical protein [Tanacetum cinerariifolium]
MFEAEVERLLALPTPPPSPLTPYSSPLPQIPSPPLPASPTYLLGYRAMMIQLRAESPSTSYPPSPVVLPHTRASMAMMRAAAPSTHILAPRLETPLLRTPPLLPIPLPASSPLLLLPSTDRRADVLEVTLPLQKRLCIALGPRFKVEDTSSAPTVRPTRGFREDYGFVGTLDAKIRCGPDREIGNRITDVWEDLDETAEEIPMIDVEELGQRVTDFVTTVRKDTDEIYGRLDDAQDDRGYVITYYSVSTADGDCRITGSRPHMTDTATRGTDSAKDIKMASKRTMRSTPATTITTTTIPVTNAQLKALIDQVVANALIARNANRSQNGEDSHDSGTGVRRQALPARECTYPNFMKCKPLYLKGTEGVVELTQWFERMESVFRISNCAMETQIKFATCTLLEKEDYKPAVQHQRRVNPKIHDIIKKEVEKLLDAGMIYPISDSPWVSPVHCVPKKGSFTVVENEENELILTRLVTGWRGTNSIVSSMVSLGIFKFPLTLVIRRKQRSPVLTKHLPIVACISVCAMHRARFKGGIVLGHKISKNGIEVDKAKVDVIAKLPHPTTVKEASILIAPNWDLPFELMCDTSDFAIGAVLGQRHEKHFRPIHYASKTMTNAETNYTTTEKEMLAVVYAFKKFRSYLIMNKSIVHTDHSAL